MAEEAGHSEWRRQVDLTEKQEENKSGMLFLVTCVLHL